VSGRSLSRRVGLAIAGGVFLLVAYAVIYRWGMAAFEGEQLSYVRALQVVLEALTTAGFGGDAPWSSTEMNALVIAMNLTGVSLVFFGIPFFLVPLLEDALQTGVPTESTLSGHVLVCADSPRETALRDELDSVDASALFVESDEDRVRELLRAGVEAIHGNPEATGTLEGANVSDARAIIVDVNDEANASIILAARRLAPEIRIVSVVEDGDAEVYHRYAGADDVVRPRVAVGERLAMKVRETQFHGSVTDPGWDDEPIELTEILVEKGSELAGQTLSECEFRQRYGLTVLGGWFHGEFIAPVDPDRRLVEHAVLLVAGHSEELTTLARDVTAGKQCERAVVAGYGVVGKTVTDELANSGIDVTIVDVEPKDDVDVVGDVTEPETLREVNVTGADSVVLALSRDSLAVYASLVVEDHAPEVETLARADDVDYVQKCYDAGAEFTLALSEVTAHMVTARLFEGHPTENRTGRCEIDRMRAPALAGRQLGDAAVRTETGAQVVAVEREGQLHPSPGPSFEIRESDALVLAGGETAIAEFERRYTGG
jgi:Trk K+ transport system NAD-binding subunit